MKGAIDSVEIANGRCVKVGGRVWSPANTSDPAQGEVVAILPSSWPGYKMVGELRVWNDPEFECLIRFDFGERCFYLLSPALECEFAQ